MPADVMLDLGATAKALAADRAAAAIEAAVGGGVLVNLGGDIRVAGDPPDGGWCVGIADDVGFDASTASIEPQQMVLIHDGGLATSQPPGPRLAARRDGPASHHRPGHRTARGFLLADGERRGRQLRRRQRRQHGRDPAWRAGAPAG